MLENSSLPRMKNSASKVTNGLRILMTIIGRN